MTYKVSRSGEEELVPYIWREIFVQIVDAIRAEDPRLLQGIGGVLPLSQEEASEIFANVTGYGDILVSLPPETWDSSVCRWMGDHWEVLVDLFTEAEGRSDLVLFSKVCEKDGQFVIRVGSVHTP